MYDVLLISACKITHFHAHDKIFFADLKKSRIFAVEIINENTMCTYTITVDEAALRKLQPSFSREAFGQWLQRHVDELVEDMTAEQHADSPIARTEEEMKAIVEERLQLMESGKATYIDGETGFAQIRALYGL